MKMNKYTMENKKPLLEKVFSRYNSQLVMFKIPGCINCSKLYDILHDFEKEYDTEVKMFDVIDLSTITEFIDEDDDDCDYDHYYDTIIEELCIASRGKRTFPKLFANRIYIGDYVDIKNSLEFNGLQDLRVRLNLDNASGDF